LALGCVTLEGDLALKRSSLVTEKSLTNIAKVKVGMPTETVEVVMGKDLVVGYSVNSEYDGGYEPIKEVQPYKTEIVTADERTYRCDYYITKIFKADGMVSEEELTPVIFRNDRVTGIGWEEKRSLDQRR